MYQLHWLEMFSSSFIFHAGAVVARVRMTKMTEVVYDGAVKAIFDCCNQENKCDLAKASLLIGQVLTL